MFFNLVFTEGVNNWMNLMCGDLDIVKTRQELCNFVMYQYLQNYALSLVTKLLKIWNCQEF